MPAHRQHVRLEDMSFESICEESLLHMQEFCGDKEMTFKVDTRRRGTVEVNALYFHTTLCHHPRCHRAVNPAGKQADRPAVACVGQTAVGTDDFGMEVMMRAGEMIAKQDDALALITGESVGQVASQTMQGIHAINAACTLPVLRPLAGMDKSASSAWSVPPFF